MEKLLKILFLCLTLTWGPAQTFAQLSYEVDIGQDGSFETGGLFYIDPEGPNVKVDFYIDDYSCPPDDELNGVDTYISLDANQVTVVDCYAFDSLHGGPFQLGGCALMEPNVYFINAGCGWGDPIVVSGRKQKFGTIELQCMGESEGFDLVVADNLISHGYPAYIYGSVNDCNLADQNPADGVVHVKQTTPPCSADFNFDDKVNLSDLVIMKSEFLLFCPPSPCSADCNDDGKVDLSDLVIMKKEFNRINCPPSP